MNPLQQYNFVPTTTYGNQFLGYRQSGSYMTDYRNSSDLYSYLINNVTGEGVTTGHKLRQYLQDNSLKISSELFQSNSRQFSELQLTGAPNTCTGSGGGIIYSGGKPLINSIGQKQSFSPQCNVPGQSCMMYWDNTPLPQQGPHCMVPPKGSNPFNILK